MFDMDELKHQLHAEWSNLNHAMVTAAIRQRHHHLSACDKLAVDNSNIISESIIAVADF